MRGMSGHSVAVRLSDPLEDGRGGASEWAGGGVVVVVEQEQGLKLAWSTHLLVYRSLQRPEC